MSRRAAEDANLLPLLNSWTSVPAVALDPHLNVVAVNEVARECLSLRPGVNLVRTAFLAHGVDRDAAEWTGVAEAVVGALRASLHANAEDESFLEIIGELATTSADFPRVWATRQEPVSTGEITCMQRGGRLRVRYTLLTSAVLPRVIIAVCQLLNPTDPRGPVAHAR